MSCGTARTRHYQRDKEQCLGDVDMAVTARQVERRVTSLVDGINIAARRDMLREGRLLVLYSREMQWGLQ